MSESTDTPRWVKIFAIVAVILLVAFVGLHLAGGGFRGHRHAPPPTVTEQSAQSSWA